MLLLQDNSANNNEGKCEENEVRTKTTEETLRINESNLLIFLITGFIINLI